MNARRNPDLTIPSEDAMTKLEDSTKRLDTASDARQRFVSRRAVTRLVFVFVFGCMLSFLGISSSARAQEDMPSRVHATWNRYYDYEQMTALLQELARAYPELVELRSIGKSQEGREMWLAIVTSSKNGPHASKPAMYIDGNVHGNEIQATEMVLYAIWYLTKAYGVNESLTNLLDRCSFYLIPSVNPDGRSHWFHDPATSSSWRRSVRPRDNDSDGLFDEDGPEDLDGDGSITIMWREDPNGDFVRSQKDPRRFDRVEPGQKGAWSFAGFEGIDNDGDGRINEDGLGGDDMNRDWPGGWQPDHIQGGAAPYPLWSPETRAIADFILVHPNIGGVQSYHNSGGMILRGPGTESRENLYPRGDVNVYDEIGRLGEKMLPYYRYMIIYKDLYNVYGGFVNWTAETLGIFSFTNELWTRGKYFQGDASQRPEDDDMWMFRDRLQFGQTFTPFTEYDHPTLGKVLIGGNNKWSSRNTPTFMLEEECHRNFAFTMYHADQMPNVEFARVAAAPVDGAPSTWTITAELANDRAIPSRAGIAARRGIGAADRLECGVDKGKVLVGGTLSNWRDKRLAPVDHEPHRLLVDDGIPGKGSRVFRFVVQAQKGAKVTLRFVSEKAKNREHVVELR